MTAINFDKIKSVLMPTLNEVKTFDPFDVMPRIDMFLISRESNLVRSFLEWVREDEANRTFAADDFHARWIEWCTVVPRHPGDRLSSSHDPRVSVTLAVDLRICVGFSLNHESLFGDDFRNRVAEVLTDRIAEAGGIFVEDIVSCDVLGQVTE